MDHRKQRMQEKSFSAHGDDTKKFDGPACKCSETGSLNMKQRCFFVPSGSCFFQSVRAQHHLAIACQEGDDWLPKTPRTRSFSFQ